MSTAIFFLALAFGVGCVMFRRTFRAGRDGMAAGWAMLIFSRSGQGFNHSVRLANCVGVIDAGFRGEVMVKLTSDALESDPAITDKPPYFVQPGDRIAQAMLVPVHRVAFEVVEELGESERGAGGLGSTGQ